MMTSIDLESTPHLTEMVDDGALKEGVPLFGASFESKNTDQRHAYGDAKLNVRSLVLVRYKRYKSHFIVRNNKTVDITNHIVLIHHKLYDGVERYRYLVKHPKIEAELELTLEGHHVSMVVCQESLQGYLRTRGFSIAGYGLSARITNTSKREVVSNG